MAYHRGAVLTGESIKLRIVFRDAAGNLIDPDSAPELYFYDSNIDIDDIELEAEAKVYTSAVAGPVTATALSTGYYEYEFTVPSASIEGEWKDLWVTTIDTIDVYEIFQFTVTQGADLDPQELDYNQMIIVSLSDTITNLAGDQDLEPIDLYYSTVYKPLYASPDLVRAEVGRWIDYIPDDTLALMIHWSSKEADFIQGAKPQNWADLELAKTKFVVYDAAWRAITTPGQGQQAGYSSGGTKQLGDLTIKEGAIQTDIPEEILTWIKDQRDEWFRVVNAGGNIVPGQGLDPTFAVKGIYDPDRRRTGRLWQDPRDFAYWQPGVNQKRRHPGRRRNKYGFYNYRRRMRHPSWDPRYRG